MKSFVVLAFLLMAGMNFGTRYETEFNKTEVAWENATGESNSFGGVCCKSITFVIPNLCTYHNYTSPIQVTFQTPSHSSDLVSCIQLPT